MLAAAATLRHPTGRFWDSDSDFECEDLGITMDGPVKLSPEFERERPVVAATPQIRRTPAKPASTPPRRPPWRNLWKGPLPPARVSPARTLADLLPPTFSAADQDGAAARSPCGEEAVVIRQRTDQCEAGTVVRGSPIHHPFDRAGPSRNPEPFLQPVTFPPIAIPRGRTCFLQSQRRRRRTLHSSQADGAAW
jgi:hypothetical protein